MTDGEVPQITFCDRLVAQSLSGMEVSWLPDNLPRAVLLQVLPQFLQPCQIPGNWETLCYHLRIVPSVPVLLTPGTTIHHTCQGHVELLVHPAIIFNQDFCQNSTLAQLKATLVTRVEVRLSSQVAHHRTYTTPHHPIIHYHNLFSHL